MLSSRFQAVLEDHKTRMTMVSLDLEKKQALIFAICLRKLLLNDKVYKLILLCLFLLVYESGYLALHKMELVCTLVYSHIWVSTL